MEPISSSLEDYLEAIFILIQKHPHVRLTDIAEFIGVSKPSVNRAVGNLKEAGLVSHETYGVVSLTAKGKQRAAVVLRRHKLIKRFLTQTLGVEEDIAERDACRMEHVMSPKTIEKLYTYIEQTKTVE